MYHLTVRTKLICCLFNLPQFSLYILEVDKSVCEILAKNRYAFPDNVKCGQFSKNIFHLFYEPNKKNVWTAPSLT